MQSYALHKLPQTTPASHSQANTARTRAGQEAGKAGKRREDTPQGERSERAEERRAEPQTASKPATKHEALTSTKILVKTCKYAA